MRMRVKDMVTFDYSMGRINSKNKSVEVYVNRPLEQAIERNAIMQDINKIAWKMKVRSKESHRINWHYARRHKETITQLEKLLADMRLEYVIQQAGGIDE
jgi:hypothetical protein